MTAITANPIRNLLDYTDCDCDGPITKDNFQAHASLEEGVSGHRRIDTTYENTETDYVNKPRSSVMETENDPDKPWRDWPNPRRGQ